MSRYSVCWKLRITLLSLSWSANVTKPRTVYTESYTTAYIKNKNPDEVYKVTELHLKVRVSVSPQRTQRALLPGPLTLIPPARWRHPARSLGYTPYALRNDSTVALLKACSQKKKKNVRKEVDTHDDSHSYGGKIAALPRKNRCKNHPPLSQSLAR